MSALLILALVDLALLLLDDQLDKVIPPADDFNDSNYGLPISIAKKIYYPNQAAIEAALKGAAA